MQRRQATVFFGRRAIALATLTIALLICASPAIASPGANASTPIGAQQDGSDEPLATLTITEDRVDVRKAGEDEFERARDGQRLGEGDTVRTDANGKAEIEYSDDSYTRLDVDTTFTVVQLTDDQGSRRVEGSLDRGRTWNRTAALTESESFEQSGGGATAAVAGTAFSVECDAVDHCIFTAVVDDIHLTGADGMRLLTPLDQCDATSGALCGDITRISPEDLPAWILENLLRDRFERGIIDPPLAGTIVIDDAGVVTLMSNAVEPEVGGAVEPEVGGAPVAGAPPATGPGGSPAPAATAPGAPTGATATAGDGLATVAFVPPDSDGGSTITNYTVTASPGGASASGPASPIAVGGLVNGTAYTFTVTATNAVGTGPASAASNSVTPATVPGPPTSATALPGFGEAEVSFAPPSDDGGSAVTSYTVTASPDGATCVTSSTSCTVTGLANHTTYLFTVTATNAAGTSAPSAATNPVTPPIVVPFGAEWRFTDDPGDGWEGLEFDDSGWDTAIAPFDDPPPDPDPFPCDEFPPGNAEFPVNGTIYLRTSFGLAGNATSLRIQGTIDNNVSLYFNGHLIFQTQSGNCEQGAIDVYVPDEYLDPGGNNVLAAVATDTGVISFFDLTIFYDPPVNNLSAVFAPEEIASEQDAPEGLPVAPSIAPAPVGSAPEPASPPTPPAGDRIVEPDPVAPPAPAQPPEPAPPTPDETLPVTEPAAPPVEGA